MMVLLTVVLDVLVAGNEGTNAEEKEVVYQYMTISDELKLTLIYVVKIKKNSMMSIETIPTMLMISFVECAI